MAVVISDLAARPDFLAVVAARLWTAWWRDEGASLAEVEALLDTGRGAGLVPSCFVAHEGDTFLATASLLADDLPLRPQLTPWLAAVWVEPAARRGGLGGAIVRHAAARAFAGGIAPLHLYCLPARVDFYARLGWATLDTGVGPGAVTVMRSWPDTTRSTG